MSVAAGPRRPEGAVESRSEGRPVLLSTLGVPIDPSARAFALASAVEAGRDLIVANVTVLEPLALSMILGYDALPELTPDVSASLQGSTELARSLGVRVERLRIRSPRPIEALIQLVGERHPGVLVFGPDRGTLSGRRYHRAVRAVLERAGCLVWVPPDVATALR